MKKSDESDIFVIKDNALKKGKMMVIMNDKDDARVTYRKYEDEGMKWGIKDLPWESFQVGKVITEDMHRKIWVAMAKLMEYEETGLLPKEVETLKEGFNNLRKTEA